MATSEQGFYERFDPTYFGADYYVDDGYSRVAVSSGNHLGDVAGQVLIDFRPPAASPAKYREPAVASTTVWQLIRVYGPFVVRLKPNGEPYQLRCAIAGFSQQGHAVDFRIAAGRRGRLRQLAEGGSFAEVPGFRQMIEATGITALTAAWLTTVIPGGAATTLLNLPADIAYLTEYPTVAALGSGVDVSARVPEIYVSVWGKTANVASKPRMSGLYVAEHWGT